MVRVKWPGGRPFKMDIDCRALYTKNESASAVLHGREARLGRVPAFWSGVSFA